MNRQEHQRCQHHGDGKGCASPASHWVLEHRLCRRHAEEAASENALTFHDFIALNYATPINRGTI